LWIEKGEPFQKMWVFVQLFMSGTAMIFEIGKTDGGFVFRDLHAPVGTGNLDRSHQRIRKHVNDSPFIPKHPNTTNQRYENLAMFSDRWIQIQIHKQNMKKSVRKKKIYPNLVNPPPKQKKRGKKKKKSKKKKKKKTFSPFCLQH